LTNLAGDGKGVDDNCRIQAEALIELKSISALGKLP
jgi:hypothetical protein